ARREEAGAPLPPRRRGQDQRDHLPRRPARPGLRARAGRCYYSTLSAASHPTPAGQAMATTPASTNEKARSPAPATPRLPPEEKFWQRYSPHHEAPLSATGSFIIHALVGGTMVLFAVYLGSLFFKPTRSLPIDPVRLNVGGGGGSRTGVGDNKG